jgi:hypothetical protein
VTVARLNLGFALARLGEPSEVELGAHTPDAVWSEDRRLEGIGRAYLAETLVGRGANDLAEREARSALRVLEAFPAVRGRALGALALVLLEQARSVEALASAAEGMALLERLGTIMTGESMLRLVHARALEATGDLAGARAAIERARARMLERAARLTDAKTRAAFLATEEHVRTVALVEAWERGQA